VLRVWILTWSHCLLYTNRSASLAQLRCHKSQHLPQRFKLDHSSSPSLCPAIALEHSLSIAAAYISRKTPIWGSFHRASSPSYSPAGCWFRYDPRTFGQLQVMFILCKESVFVWKSLQFFEVNVTIVMSPHNKILCSYNIMMSSHINFSIIMSQHNKLLCIYNIMMS
jgi:hypothetical protein